MLILFEDEHWRSFAPMTYTRPLFDMRCGAFTARERAAALLFGPRAALPALAPASRDSVRASLPDAKGQPDGHPGVAVAPGPPGPPGPDSPNGQEPAPPPIFGLCRAALMGCYGPPGGVAAMLRESTPITLVNGRALDLAWLPNLRAEPIGTVYASGGVLLGAHLSPALASLAIYYLREQLAADALAELSRFGRLVELEARLCTWPWELITQAGEQLVRDLPLLAARLPRYQPTDPHIVVRGDHIYVAPSARLDGPLVLDARDGPIFIDAQAHIEPFSLLQGPAYIGAKTLISSALVRGETSIGPVCRIGGEVEASTIQGYTNKHHEGFLGHSWMGEWVNIGAMTTNSDLKNTYGSIKVVLEGHGQIDSGQVKLGCFLADHVKLGIGLHMTGGAIIGTGSNLFGIHMVPKTVPPFTWGSEVFYEYSIDRMVGVARKVMQRRKEALSVEQEAMLRAVFAMTRANRDAFGATSERDDAAPPHGATRLQLLARAEEEAIRGATQRQPTARG